MTKKNFFSEDLPWIRIGKGEYNIHFKRSCALMMDVVQHFTKTTHLNIKYNSLGSISYMFKSYLQNKKFTSWKFTSSYITKVLHIQFLLFIIYSKKHNVLVLYSLFLEVQISILISINWEKHI